jgi:hypothetical protein
MARTSKPKTKPAASTKPGTKAQTLIALLKPKRGVTINEMMAATGWQAHSVRGFLAGSLKKQHGLEAMSEKRDGEPRRYRLR